MEETNEVKLCEGMGELIMEQFSYAKKSEQVKKINQ